MKKPMKNSRLFCLALVVLCFSCSTDVDLYGDYAERPIIYGLLDAKADTNFVKITRAFSVQGNAYETALNPDSSNYPGRLDVRLVELCDGDSVREIVLDSITLHNKVEGTFYAPDQKLYYTAEPLQMNGSHRYAYRLKVVLPDRTLVTTTDMVGSSAFAGVGEGVTFSHEYYNIPRYYLFRPAVNATFYNVDMSFTFLEQRTPDADSVPRTMTWNIGTFTDYYFDLYSDGDYYSIPFYAKTFFQSLKDFLGSDTAVAGLQRFIGDYPVEVTVAAGGEGLRQYIYNNDPSNGFAAGDNEFSLIDGGYGVFSSRTTFTKKLRLAGETVPELVENPYWGFKFIGGND